MYLIKHGFTRYILDKKKTPFRVDLYLINSGNWATTWQDNQKYSMILVWGHEPGTQSYGTSECLVPRYPLKYPQVAACARECPVHGICCCWCYLPPYVEQYQLSSLPLHRKIFKILPLFPYFCLLLSLLLLSSFSLLVTKLLNLMKKRGCPSFRQPLQQLPIPQSQ